MCVLCLPNSFSTADACMFQSYVLTIPSVVFLNTINMLNNQSSCVVVVLFVVFCFVFVYGDVLFFVWFFKTLLSSAETGMDDAIA